MNFLRSSFIMLILPLTCSCLHAAGQPAANTDSLICHIAAQQVQADAFFLPGIFPSYISRKPVFQNREKNNNIFFNALIHYTFRSLEYSMDSLSIALYHSMHAKNSTLLPHFKNTKGRYTYNFLRTDSVVRFPYTKWIGKIKKNTALPDDLDCTALCLLMEGSDSSSAALVHNVMQSYVNDSKAKNKSLLKSYKHYQAYSSWFGKKFPVVYDVCVLANVLTFVQLHHLSWTAADSASLGVITEALRSHDYLTKAIYIAPYYGKPSIILYHIARLMQAGVIPALESWKPELIKQALVLFYQSSNILEKVILSTAIIKWGGVPPPLALPDPSQREKSIEANNLPFFIGNIPSYFPLWLKKRFTENGWGIFYHYCPAFNDALLYEYLVLKQQVHPV